MDVKRKTSTVYKRKTLRLSSRATMIAAATFLLLVLLALLTLGTSFVLSPQATGCSITLSKLDPEPIVVSDNDYQFLYADASSNSDDVSISANEDVVISCPGGQLSSGSTNLGTTISATCQSGTSFTANSRSINFNQITCSRQPFHTARYTGQTCELQGRQVEIGFVLTNNSFAREIVTCFDDKNRNSLYSAYTITKSIGHHESGVDRPSFIEDNFYNLGTSVNNLYERGGQRSTINALLGLSANSTKYIQDSSDYYLARGHLAAKAAFVYAPQQLATFHYVNAAPQWQTFNGNNWNTAESDVRDYAEKNGVDLLVYTGTYGVATLPHATTGADTPLFLSVDKNGNKALPVPQLYWKAVYNKSTKQGVVLLGVNNPYETNPSKYIICKDISSSINWLHWKATSIEYGYSYACAVDDFRKKVSYLPQFDVSGLLL